MSEPVKIPPRPYTNAELYRDWRNNFLTVERFADWYMLTLEEAKEVIRLGRIEHEAGVTATGTKCNDLSRDRDDVPKKASDVPPECKQSAKLAARVISFYNRSTCNDHNETNLTDLLADLRHWCDSKGIDFAECDSNAYNHYVTERNGGL